MWHEARKQEKLVRKVIVDYRKRAERRHDYYEKIKQDPTKFMQIHGRTCKFHIDENGVASDSKTHMMPWQGDKTNMIDRFDVRAHLDIIPNVKSDPNFDFSTDKQERKCQYERYRILIYNKHRGVSETQHLKQIAINENFPVLTSQKQEAESKKQLLAASKATIAYSYEDEGSGPGSSGSQIKHSQAGVEEDDEEDDWSDEEFLTELEDVPSINDLNIAALTDLENLSFEFGLYINDFSDSLHSDQNIQDKMNKVKALESEKAKMAGKKSRRERRILKDSRLRNRTVGPLSYILRQADDDEHEAGSESESSSSSSEEEQPLARKSTGGGDSGKIEFITSFGENNKGSSDTSKLPQKPTPVRPRNSHQAKRRSRSRSKRSRSRSRSPQRRRRSRSRSRERRRDRDDRRRSRSPHERRRSRSHDRHKRSRSRSRGRHSRSPERRRRSRSRSRGAEKPVATVKSTSTPQTPGSQTKKLTPQERLKIKMQRALKKQLKADKVATADKQAKAFQDQLDREDELRAMSRKIRKKEDERDDLDSPLRGYRY